MNIIGRKITGHYCKICGERKSNESFSGTGQANHICKVCSRMSPSEQSEAQTMTRLENLAFRKLAEYEIKWLVNRTKDKRPAVREYAWEIYTQHFPNMEKNNMKKELYIRKLEFSVSTDIDDCTFVVERNVNSIIKISHGTQKATAANLAVTELLTLIVNEFEIFTWEEQFADSDTSDSVKSDVWHVNVSYTNGTTQNLGSGDDLLPEPVIDLYDLLNDYFNIYPENDYYNQMLVCEDLISLSNVVRKLLSENNNTIADVWQKLMVWSSAWEETHSTDKSYIVLSGNDACMYFMINLLTTTDSEEDCKWHSSEYMLGKFINYIKNYITEPKLEQVSAGDIDKIMECIEERYALLKKVLPDNQLKILLINNSHINMNSICNYKRNRKDSSKISFELYLLHNRDNHAGHPAYVFLHEIGHILQVKITGDPHKTPESFIEISNTLLGTHLIQDETSPELFADAFAIAMMKLFDWKDYDPFSMLAPVVKNTFKQYIPTIIEKL